MIKTIACIASKFHSLHYKTTKVSAYRATYVGHITLHVYNTVVSNCDITCTLNHSAIIKSDTMYMFSLV
jgi:hypothetical protein